MDYFGFSRTIFGGLLGKRYDCVFKTRRNPSGDKPNGERVSACVLLLEKNKYGSLWETVKI
jgi:hypothetical protein